MVKYKPGIEYGLMPNTEYYGTARRKVKAYYFWFTTGQRETEGPFKTLAAAKKAAEKVGLETSLVPKHKNLPN